MGNGYEQAHLRVSPCFKLRSCFLYSEATSLPGAAIASFLTSCLAACTSFALRQNFSWSACTMWLASGAASHRMACQ